MLAEIEPVLERDEVRALRRGRAIVGAGSGGLDGDLSSPWPRAPRRRSASAIGLRQVLPVQTKRMCILKNISETGRERSRTLTEPNVPPRAGVPRGASRPRAPVRASDRCSLPRSTAARVPGRRRRASAARPLSTSAETASAMRSGPGAGGCPGRLAEVEVSGRPSRGHQCARSRRATVWRTAMPPSGPRSASGSFPSPPGQHQRERAGPERVRDSASRRRRRTPAPTLPPSRGRRSGAETACRGGRPLSAARASSAGRVGAEPRP